MELAGEEDPITIEGQEGILQLVERLEVKRIGHTDRRAMIAVTPRHLVAIFDEDYTGVIAIDPLPDLPILALEV